MRICAAHLEQMRAMMVTSKLTFPCSVFLEGIGVLAILWPKSILSC
jgi:hypothetical protein